MNVKEKILKIMELALEINPPDIEAVGRSRTAVFMEWHPHVNLLDIRIYRGGYGKSDEAERYENYTCGIPSSENTLEEIIEVLEKIKEEEADVC